MNFDFGWFLTVPGMLITGGVLLLIIALIILIATNKKKKDDIDEVDNSSDIANQPVMDQVSVDAGAGITTDYTNATAMPEMTGQPVSMEADSLMNMPSPVMTEQVGEVPSSMDMNVQGVASAPEVMPEQGSIVTPEVVNPVGNPVMETPVVESPEVAPVMGTPAINPVMDSQVAAVMPEAVPTVNSEIAPVDVNMADSQAMVNPVVSAPEVAPTVEPLVTPEVVETPVVTPDIPTVVEAPIETPTVMPTIEESAPVVEPLVMPQPVQETPMSQPVQMPEAPVQPEPAPVIYGGASPAVSNINVEEPTHQIYGGANPLENTQSIPISNIAGPNAQAQVQTPVAEPTLVTPQVEPIQVQNIEQ